MPMKVTVCFDNVRVIVPCGEGEILVRELIQKAITRYKKATGKSSNHSVAVHNVKTISGGGILDHDDMLNDVVDDREQLIAEFEEQSQPGLQHNGGDGASASSTGTASPDIFHSGDHHASSPAPQPFPVLQQNGKTDVIVTSRELSIGSNLKVRRGSEPALNTLVDGPDRPVENGDVITARPPSSRAREESRESDDPRTESDSEEDSISHGKNFKKEKSPLGRFTRDAVRQSLSNRPDMYKWLEAQEKQEENVKKVQPERTGLISGNLQSERSGPVGGSGNETEVKSPPKPSESTIVIILKNDGGPLGIHVIPDIDDNGREQGLMIQGIEPGGRIQRDGRLQVHDRIVEINRIKLVDVSFDSAQKIFREAMKTSEIRMKVVKRQVPPLPRQPPPIMPKPKGHAPVKPSPLTLPPPKGDDSPPSSPEKTSTPAEKEILFTNNNNNIDSGDKNVSFTPFTGGKIANNVKPNRLPGSPIPSKDNLPIKPGPPIKVGSPTKKTPPAVPVRHPSTTLTAKGKEQPINTLTNTRKIGKKILIQLKKGPLGLGFSVTSRDNPTGENCPIYIKNILAKGAAVTDGRLKSGDRLLEVNSTEVTGMTQTEAVALLRNIPQGGTVSLVVSRQEAVDEMFKVPRELTDDTSAVLQPTEKSGDDGTLTSMKNKEVQTLEIPLNDTGSAGLGVSVKGKTSTTVEGTRDLGIFIKSVMHGGAASKDGRLLINDQLLEVNGVTLSGMPNVFAMDELRKAMQSEGPKPGYIILTIARKIGAPSPFPFSESSSDTMDMSQPELLMHGVHVYSDSNNTRTMIQDTAFSQQNSAKGDNLNRGENSNSVRSGGTLERTKPQNPLLERLITGGNLRNDSYTRATHDSFGESPSSSSFKSNLQGATVSQRSGGGEVVIIEDDTYAVPKKQQQQQRPHSTLGVPYRTPSHSGSSSFEEYNKQEWSHPQDLTSKWSSDHPNQDETDLSPTGDFQFEREGFGRQSVSEKRKGHIDPRGSEFYQRAKEQREMKGMADHESLDSHDESSRLTRSGSMESLSTSGQTNITVHDPRPSQVPRHFIPAPLQLNLKRSSSLEDLGPQGESVSEEDIPMWRIGRIGRPRACNDSFRAAVDRSYDPPTDRNIMDTLEEESTESGSVSHGQSNSARSSFSSENTMEDFHSLRKKKKDKKGGILKGFLRFGKNRKSNEENIRRSRSAERPASEEKQRHIDQERAWRLAQQEQERIKEQRLKQEQQALKQQALKQQALEQQQKQQRMAQQEHLINQYRYIESGNNYTGETYNPASMEHMHPAMMSGGGLSRAEKIQQLRAEHQRRHRERQGQYPNEDKEELYEQQLQTDEKYGYLDRSRDYGRLRPPSRGQQERPNSRLGSIDPEVGDYRQYPNVSDNSDYSDQGSLHSHGSNFPSRRPPSRGGYGEEEWFRGRDLDFNNTNRRTAFTRIDSPGGNKNFYGDPTRAYRDPTYPSVAGRRPVQTISDPSSAKV